MSGMEAASAGIALVGFVATTIQQLNKLIKTIQNAQVDLSGLLEYLEQLESSLTGADSLIRRLAGNADQHESIIKIDRAVKYCYKTLKSLEVLVEKINGSDRSPNKLKKTMTSLKYYLKKDDVLGVQNQLEYAMSNLNLAISIDDSHRTRDIHDEVTSLRQLFVAKPTPMLLTDSSQSAPSRLAETNGTPLWPVDSSHSVASAILDTLDTGNKQLSLVKSNVTNQRPSSFTETSQSAPNRFLEDHQKPSLPIEFNHRASQDGRLDLLPLDARRPSGMVSKESVATWYNGCFGTVTIQKKSNYVGSSLGVRTVDAKSMSEEILVLLWPSFLKYHYELRSRKSFGRISRTLNVERVVDNRDPVFQMCRSGDIMGLIGAFHGGRASPDMVNRYGMGLLHYAAGSHQLETCKLLLDYNVDVNRADGWRKKALTYVANQPSHDKVPVDTKTVLTIADLLARRQEELSALDISNYFQHHHHGPPEALELILSVNPPQYDIYSQDDDFGQSYPMLAAALEHYARDRSTWEPILRNLIRRGADLHAPVRRNRRDVKTIGYPCLLGEYGTPLDELFTSNRDHEAAKMAADGWLQILASEGKNLSLYLKKEMMIRAKDMHFTHPSMSAIAYDIPRRLFFQLGDHTSVFWDWWVDPASSTFSLREEFKCLVTTSPDWLRIAKPWKEQWPFVFPKWSELHQGYVEEPMYSRCKAFLVRADDRAVRRLRKKAAKLTRAQRPKGAQSVPGAWVA